MIRKLYWFVGRCKPHDGGKSFQHCRMLMLDDCSSPHRRSLEELFQIHIKHRSAISVNVAKFMIVSSVLNATACIVHACSDEPYKLEKLVHFQRLHATKWPPIQASMHFTKIRQAAPQTNFRRRNGKMASRHRLNIPLIVKSLLKGGPNFSLYKGETLDLSGRQNKW